MTQIKKLLSLFVLLMITLFQTACDREDNLSALTESEAIELIASSLQNNAGGVTSNVEDLAEQLTTAVASGDICDSLYTDTIEKNYDSAQIQATYTSDLTYEMSCNALDIPQIATFSSSTTSTYNTSRVASEGDALFSGNASGIQPSSPTISLEGNYSKNGSQEANFATQKNINSTFIIDLAEMIINKESMDIESGLGTFSYSGMTQENDFSYTGSMVFNGDGTLTLIINGSTYIIELD